MTAFESTGWLAMLSILEENVRGLADGTAAFVALESSLGPEDEVPVDVVKAY